MITTTARATIMVRLITTVIGLAITAEIGTTIVGPAVTSSTPTLTLNYTLIVSYITVKRISSSPRSPLYEP